MTGPFQTNAKCLLTELEDGTGVVLHLDTKLYYTLNETGVFVWKCLESEQLDEDALLARLLNEFEVEPDRARADLTLVLGTLSREGLVQASTESTGA